MISNPNSENLVKLTKNDIKRASKVSGRAFFDDPFLKYAYPDEKKRLKKIGQGFKMVYKLGLYNGEGYAISDNLEGIAIWIPPKNVHSSFWTTLKSGSLATSFKMVFDFKTVKKSLKIFGYMESQHKLLVPYEHWYLQHLVVEPEEQGKGYGSILLNSMFKKIDAQGIPIYVDTNNDDNIPFYQKHGFEILKHEIIPKTDVPLCCMVRNPN